MKENNILILWMIIKKNELKIFNNECYISWPNNTNEKNSERVFVCSYYFYKSENGLYICLS